MRFYSNHVSCYWWECATFICSHNSNPSIIGHSTAIRCTYVTDRRCYALGKSSNCPVSCSPNVLVIDCVCNCHLSTGYLFVLYMFILPADSFFQEHFDKILTRLLLKCRMKKGFYGLRGKELSLVTIALMCTVIIMLTWEKTPLLNTIPPPQTRLQLSLGMVC